VGHLFEHALQIGLAELHRAESAEGLGGFHGL
jgi:hypothetical protein